MLPASFMPSLIELRTFEAVARLRSISAAAAELGCSQPSVTHRVKSLEDRWGTVLFKRSTRSLEWTDRTALAYERVRRILSEIDTMAEEMANVASTCVSISVSPSFASGWLVGRLSSFRRMHPAIEIKVNATNRFVNLAGEGYDIAIRLLGLDKVPAEQLTFLPLPTERFLVVCSPHYAARFGKVFKVAALHSAELLWQDGTDHWPRFFQEALPDGPKPVQSMTFNNADLVVRGAIDSQGIAIIRQSLVYDAMEHGSLVQLGTHCLDCQDRYYVVTQGRPGINTPRAKFIQWLFDEMTKCVI